MTKKRIGGHAAYALCMWLAGVQIKAEFWLLNGYHACPLLPDWQGLECFLHWRRVLRPHDGCLTLEFREWLKWIVHR